MSEVIDQRAAESSVSAGAEQVAQPETVYQAPPQQTIVIQNQSSFPTLGFLSIVFSVLGIFSLAILFAPLGFLFGLIGLFSGQVATSLGGLLLSMVAVITSPVILALIGLSSLVQ